MVCARCRRSCRSARSQGRTSVAGRTPEGSPDRRMPRTGAYYWVPITADSGHHWVLCTSRDAGLNSDGGHTRLWVYVLDRLAITWGKDRMLLRRRLEDGYACLPRGRVTRTPRSYLILHGRDAPLIDWPGVVANRFDLPTGRTRILYDEHERMIAGDPEAVERVLGIALGLRGI